MKFIYLFFISGFLFGQSFQITTGGYTGSGSGQSITGLGFQPKVVFIKGDGTIEGRVKTDAHPTTNTNSWDNSLNDNSITSLDSDGFTVVDSAETDAIGVAYNYVAFAGTSDLIETGTYVGNGVNGRVVSLSNTSIEIGLLMIFSDDASASSVQVWRGTAHTGLNSTPFRYAVNANSIKGIGTGSFTVGSGVNVNTNLVNYYYVAIANNSNVVESGTYTGDGNDDRTITLANSSLDFSWVTTHWDVNNIPTVYSSDYILSTYGDRSYKNMNITYDPDMIQSFSPGSFVIGSHVRVNTDAATYYYFVLANYSADTGQDKGFKETPKYKKFPGWR